MRYLTIVALAMLATPALAQSTTAPGPVACTCAPAVAPVHARAPIYRHRRPRVIQAYAPAYPPSPVGYGFAATTSAVAPAAYTPSRDIGILGPIQDNSWDSLAALGLGYTDGVFGSEAGYGGSGPLHAGY